MPDFDFSDLDPTGRVAPYTLPIRKSPVLRGRFAGESNEAYHNAMLRAMRPLRGRQADVDVLRQDRDNDRALFARHVVVGWARVHDKSGTEVPFSQEACAAFLRALPDDVFDMVRAFYKNPFNFTADAVADAEAIAKN